jgi:hypothetical protein
MNSNYCIDCNKKLSRTTIWRKHLRCISCALKYRQCRPEFHWNYKGGLPKCIDCDKELANYGTERCQSCAAKKKYIIPENNPAHIDGRSLIPKFCKDCGKELKNKKAKYCKKCMELGERNHKYIDGRASNKDYIKEYQRNRRKTNINVKLAHNLGSRLRNAIKYFNKSEATMKLVGCSLEQLKKHLENKFTQGMSWANYGKWHVDHIRPCASFDLRKPSEQRKCFHYTNLQPLWAIDNLEKNDKII